MTLEEIRNIGAVQLEIMDEVHRICTENQITYYMIGGTLLGAVRHKGFIPWDLDIDIAMQREDYERFKQVCSTSLDVKYRYLDYQSCRNYMRPHALISHNGTRVHIKYDCVNPATVDLGIYIDIFPLDHAPDDEKERQRHAERLKRIRRLKDRRLMYCYSFNRWRRLIHYAVASMLFWIPIPWLNQCQQKQMQKYRNQKTECICSMASKYKYSKQCMPREIYGTPVLLEFEGRQYYAPEKYIEYLTQLYGDYMRLPPEEERQANLEIFTAVEYL